MKKKRELISNHLKKFVNEINTSAEKLEKIIFEFIKNRTDQNESTTSRHIHRRFDVDMEKAEQILTDLSEKKTH